ncbi:hypothetical protein AALP_AA6G051100 [Arabis alpina]|uniref:DUF577 domain-containing protein n=1 Tax=Arabis alpina TaxID=50452 RepID=A0A087GM67_ARAAL|nr:hypothetical protein AALP_AA6G051100 [Arabis alpina]
MQETHMKILRKIVSFVAYDVVSLDNNGWDELSECILSFAETEPFKAFHVFIELQRVYWRFIERFMDRIGDEAEKVLSKEGSDVGEWSLGLVTLVKLGIQILDSGVEEWRVDLVKFLMTVVVDSVRVLVKKKGREQFVIQGLENLERFLLRDKVLYRYSKDQCNFVSTFMYKIRQVSTKIMEVAKKIHRLVNRSKNQDFDHFCFEQLNGLSLLDIVKVFVLPGTEEKGKEMAIRRLNLLLSLDHSSEKSEYHVSFLRYLQPLLVSSLSKDGISESMFRIVGEVVYHDSYEMMNVQEETWFGLRDYIVSKSKTEFQRAVYIFCCLTMPLNEEEFVIPVMESLLPEISSRLNPPPSKVLVDNSEWVLAFTGAFCAIIHLIEVESQAESVKEIAYKMIDSVRELVERGMEVGLVRRAFRDVESIVKKDLEWFGASEYKFIKGLLWRLYEIKDMKMESRIVLWRINVRIERGVTALFKELLESVLDWLNQWVKI